VRHTTFLRLLCLIFHDPTHLALPRLSLHRCIICLLKLWPESRVCRLLQPFAMQAFMMRRKAMTSLWCGIIC
jgi:hypothetical protein